MEMWSLPDSMVSLMPAPSVKGSALMLTNSCLSRPWVLESNNDQCNMFIYGVPNLGIPLRHILGQIAARPRSTLTPVSNHGFTDPLAAESLENMNKKLGFESVGFLTDGF